MLIINTWFPTTCVINILFGMGFFLFLSRRTRKINCWSRMCGWNWSGTTWICAGTPRTMAALRICVSRRTASGSRTCWCTTVRMRDSTGHTRPTWLCGTTGPACTCRPVSSNRPARSTSRGFPSTTSGARWSSAAGPTTDSRFDSVSRASKATRKYSLEELVVVMLDQSDNSRLLSYICIFKSFIISLIYRFALIRCEWDIYIVLPSPRISYKKLDLQLQDETGGDISSYVLNGEWELLGE